MTKMGESVRLSPNQDHLLDIRRFWWRNQDTDLILVSGSVSVGVHGAVVLPMSQFLSGLVPASCPCTKPAIILPPQLEDVLPGLVELLYTGTSNVDSKDAVDKVHDILKLLQIDVDVCSTGREHFHGERVEGFQVMHQAAPSGSVHREYDGPVVFNANESLPLVRREKSAGTNIFKQRKSKRVSVRVVTQSEKKQIMNRMDHSKLEKRHFREIRKESCNNNPGGFYMDGSSLEEGIIPIMDLPSVSGKWAGGETLSRDKPKNRKRKAGITSSETSSGKKKIKRMEDVELEKESISNESSKKKYVNVVFMDGSFPEKGIIPIFDLPRLSAKNKKNPAAQNKTMECKIIEYSRKNDVCYDENNDEDDEEIEEIPRRDDEYSGNGIEISVPYFSITIKYPSREKP